MSKGYRQKINEIPLMPALKHYEPPRIILFGNDGRQTVAFGFTCAAGPQASTSTCSSGLTAMDTCSNGCTAQGCGSQGCKTGDSASCNCNSGTNGPFGMTCGMTVCCTGASGSNWPVCTSGMSASFMGACWGGMSPCGGECLSQDLCKSS